MVSYENEKKGRIPLVRDLMSVLGCMKMYMVRSPEKPNRQVIGRDEKGDEFWLPHNDALQHIYNDFHGNFLEVVWKMGRRIIPLRLLFLKELKMIQTSFM